MENLPKEGKNGLPIHREAPKFEDLSTSTEVLFTGIKVIDLIEPYAKGGKIGLFGGAGVGKTVLIHELHQAFAGRRHLYFLLRIKPLYRHDSVGTGRDGKNHSGNDQQNIKRIGGLFVGGIGHDWVVSSLFVAKSFAAKSAIEEKKCFLDGIWIVFSGHEFT